MQGVYFLLGIREQDTINYNKYRKIVFLFFLENIGNTVPSSDYIKTV